MIIKQGKDTPLGSNSGTVPNMSDTLLNWFQQMTFGVVTKTAKNFQVYETMEEVSFLGVWQVLNARQLSMKPEGQQAWDWFMVHSQPQLNLNTDNVIIYLGKQYRVMAKKDYSLYGYIEYHLVDDYTASGPTPVEAP